MQSKIININLILILNYLIYLNLIMLILNILFQYPQFHTKDYIFNTKNKYKPKSNSKYKNPFKYKKFINKIDLIKL